MMRLFKWFGIFAIAFLAVAGCQKGSETAETAGETATEAPAAGTSEAPPAATAATPTGLSTALDGKTFAIQMTNTSDPAAAKQPDQLIFVTGSFESTACRAYGFTVSGYQVEDAAGMTKFNATSKSPTGGTMEWTGTIRGSEVDGTAKHTDQAGKVTLYTYTGSLAATG